MKQSKSLLLTALLSGSILLSGCQSIGGSSSSASADPRLTKTGTSERLFGSSGLEACAVGALAGGGLGALVGAIKGDSKDAAVGAAIGAAAGCAAGYGVDSYLENNEKKYQTKESRLNAQIKDMRDSNNDLRAYINDAKNVLAQDQKQLAQLQKQLNSKSLDQANAKKQLEKADANIKAAQKRLESEKAALANYQEIAKKEQAKGSNTQKHQEEIKKLKSQVEQLNKVLEFAVNNRKTINFRG